MRLPADGARGSTEDQLRELARILAAGFLRTRARAIPVEPTTLPAPEQSPESAQDCLELPAHPRLTVHTG
jgi:hypothetical protein